MQLSQLHQPSKLIFSHRIHRIHRTFLLRFSPTEFTDFTEASCREGSPTDSTDLHRCRMVWHPAVPTQPLTQPTICVDQCNPWENCIPTERRIHSKHAQSVRICEICGSFFSAKHPKMQQKQFFFEKICRNIWWFHKKAIPLHSL